MTTSPAIERQLERCAGAAWAVDPLRALLVSANGAGYARLGVEAAVGTQSNFPLDPASPAIRALREIAGDIGPGEKRLATLVVATARGEEALICAIHRPADDPRVLIVSPNDVAQGPIAQTLSDPERHDNDTTTPGATTGTPAIRTARSDAETLAEIARRIRAAQAELRKTGAASEALRPAPVPHVVSDSIKAPDATHAARPSEQARLAHELRTPLSAIVAASEIMKDERFGPLGDERYRGYAADIHDSARHALGVINAMIGGRDPANVDAGQNAAPQLQFAELDVNAIAESAVSSLQPLAAAAGIALTIVATPNLPRVIADAVSVRQIILNLLTNSLKFTRPGGRIEVKTGYQTTGPVRIEVIDSGRGMSAEDVAAALAPDGAHRPRVSDTHRAPGSLGIGLSVVRSLSVANGAKLDIASTLGRGTSVVIAFGSDRIIPI